MERLKNVTIQFKYRNDGATYIFSEEDTNTLVKKFQEKSSEVVTFIDKDKERVNAKIHINLNTVGILEEEDLTEKD